MWDKGEAGRRFQASREHLSPQFLRVVAAMTFTKHSRESIRHLHRIDLDRVSDVKHTN